MLREFIRDVLYDHIWELFDSENNEYGIEADYNKAPDAQWRCKCGWTTMDGISEYTDHSEHVADCVVKALKSRNLVSRFI